MRHRFWGRTAFVAAALSGLVGFTGTGCSSDEGGDGTGGNGGGGNGADPLKPPPRTSGSIFDDLDVAEPKTDSDHKIVRYVDVKSPYPDAAGCMEFESAYPDVHDCSCDKCFALQQQCDALQGCIEIAECGIDIGCRDANSCYLVASNPKCIPIIDKWGNTGTAAALSLALSGCLFDNGCRK